MEGQPLQVTAIEGQNQRKLQLSEITAIASHSHRKSHPSEVTSIRSHRHRRSQPLEVTAIKSHSYCTLPFTLKTKEGEPECRTRANVDERRRGKTLEATALGSQRH